MLQDYLRNQTISLNNATLLFHGNELQILEFVNYYIYEILGSLIFAFGILFNVLSFTYFQLSRSFKDTSMRYYFSVISVTDSLHLIEWPIIMLVDKKVVNLTVGLCKFLVFVTTVNGLISIWLLVVLSIERYIILKYPFQGKIFYKTKTSIKILVLIISVIVTMNIPFLVPSVIRSTYSNYTLSLYMCNINPKFYFYMLFNNLLFFSFIPFLILFIFNILLIYLLAQQKKTQRRLFILPNMPHISLKQEKKFKEKTIFLILVSFFLIFTLSPRYIVQILLFFDFLKNFSVFSITKCLIVLEMFNFSFNFFFYILCSKTSRCEFFLIFYYFFYWKWSKKSKVCFCNQCTSQLYQQQKQNTKSDDNQTDQKHEKSEPHRKYNSHIIYCGNKGTFSAINSQYQYLCRLSQQANINCSINKLNSLRFDQNELDSVYAKLNKYHITKNDFVHYNNNTLSRVSNIFQRNSFHTASDGVRVKYNFENNYINKTDYNDDDSAIHQTIILSHKTNKPRLQTFLMRHSNLSSRFPYKPASIKFKT